MKRESLTTTLLILCILGLAVFLTACGRDCFVGSRIAEAGSYRLDIDRMTGTDRFTMELSAGDTLAVQFETVKGSICMEIKEPGESSLYAGNGMIRRKHPKGTDFATIPASTLKKTEEWINNYPRKIFNFHTAAEVFEACMNSL